jgi:hypothetical protein
MYNIFKNDIKMSIITKKKLTIWHGKAHLKPCKIYEKSIKKSFLNTQNVVMIKLGNGSVFIFKQT